MTIRHAGLTEPGVRALPRPEDPGMVAWRAFLHAHAAIMRRLEADLDLEQDISLADFDVLVQLASGPDDGLRMSELADRVLLSRSGMTRRVDRLEAAGLVARKGCDADRRGAYAVITGAGAERLEAALPTHLRGIDEHFLGRLAPDETACIAGCMGRLAARASGWVSPSVSPEECVPTEVGDHRPARHRPTDPQRGH